MKYRNVDKFTDLSFALKQKDLKEFKTKLELFYYETEWIEPTNEDQEKDLGSRKVVLDAASNLYNNLLRIYSNQFNEFKSNKKKRIAFKNRTKNVSLEEHYNYEAWFSEDEYKESDDKKE